MTWFAVVLCKLVLSPLFFVSTQDVQVTDCFLRTAICRDKIIGERDRYGAGRRRWVRNLLEDSRDPPPNWTMEAHQQVPTQTVQSVCTLTLPRQWILAFRTPSKYVLSRLLSVSTLTFLAKLGMWLRGQTPVELCTCGRSLVWPWASHLISLGLFWSKLTTKQPLCSLAVTVHWVRLRVKTDRRILFGAIL